jgi:hypothetical protein
LRARDPILRRLAGGSAAPARYEAFALQLTPFTTVEFEGDKAIVIYDGAGYELAAINGLTTAEILDFCRRQYGSLWDIRFTEDLVDVLTEMNHPMNAAHTVTVTLLDPRTGQIRTVQNVPVTKENRKDVIETLHPETNTAKTSTAFGMSNQP